MDPKDQFFHVEKIRQVKKELARQLKPSETVSKYVFEEMCVPASVQLRLRPRAWVRGSRERKGPGCKVNRHVGWLESWKSWLSDFLIRIWCCTPDAGERLGGRWLG